VGEARFLDHGWQLDNSVTELRDLAALVGVLTDERFLDDLHAGLEASPMALRLTPYTFSLINWRRPRRDPLRRLFLPLASEREPDHPMCRPDALKERRSTVATRLVQRYPDKALLLALDACPVHCRCCTRAWATGRDTVDIAPSRHYWGQALRYLARSAEIEDVVLSGGDLCMLAPDQLLFLGRRLLGIEHIRRIRFATKSLAALPQLLLSARTWRKALEEVAAQARQRGVQVCLHTHFDHPAEITEHTRRAADLLFQQGIPLRSQTVLLRGVNDDPATMILLLRRLAWINVQPYYVYLHDLVPGVECLRTTLADAAELEKQVRGHTAGFMTPGFVCDLAGGAGKRDVHAYERYDRARGVAVFRSPVMHTSRLYFHFDPLRALAPEWQRTWGDEGRREGLMREVGVQGNALL